MFVKNYFSWNGFQREPSLSLRWYLSEGQSVQSPNKKVFCFQVIVRNYLKKKRKRLMLGTGALHKFIFK